MLEKMGATVSCIHNGDGLINEKCGSEHMESLQNLVTSEKALIGIAHDGDGDRARFVDRTGNVIDGDQILGLLALSAKRKENLDHLPSSPRFTATKVLLLLFSKTMSP